MVRFEIEGSPIKVAYGFDEGFSNYFLSVYDERLEYDDKASDEVNKVVENEFKDGTGVYFDLHTGRLGFGIKVSQDTIKVYLARFGVSKEKIDELFSGKYLMNEPELELENFENIDISKSETVCEKCKCVHESENNKLICDALPFPAKNTKVKSVYAIYLPEDGDKPIFVSVPIKIKYDKYENCYWDQPQFDSFLGKNRFAKSSFMCRNPLNQKRSMTDKLLITYREDFLKDGCSKTNQLIKKMKGKSFHDWRGPVVVMKALGTEVDSSESYIDIGPSDFPDITDFFLWYGKKFLESL